jgi:hypothetical protein
MRMQIRRLTRLTDAFSKKLENHKAAVALHYTYYNFCGCMALSAGSLRWKPGSLITLRRIEELLA